MEQISEELRSLDEMLAGNEEAPVEGTAEETSPDPNDGQDQLDQKGPSRSIQEQMTCHVIVIIFLIFISLNSFLLHEQILLTGLKTQRILSSGKELQNQQVQKQALLMRRVRYTFCCTILHDVMKTCNYVTCPPVEIKYYLAVLLIFLQE